MLEKHLTRKECSVVISSLLQRGADPAHIARLLHVGEGAVGEYGKNEATIPPRLIKDIEILMIEFSSGRLKLQKRRQETPWKKYPGGRPRASIAEPEEVPAKEEIPAEPEAIRSHSKKPEWSIKLDSGFDLTPEAFFRGLKIFLQLTRRSYPDMSRLTAIAPISWHRWHRSKCVPSFKTAVRIAELLNEHYQIKRAAKAEAQATHTQTMAGVTAPASNNITSTEEIITMNDESEKIRAADDATVMAGLRRTIAEQTQRISALEGEVKAQSAAIEAAELEAAEERTALKKEIEALRGENNDLEDRIAQLSEENEQRNRALDSAPLRRAKALINELTDRLIMGDAS